MGEKREGRRAGAPGMLDRPVRHAFLRPPEAKGRASLIGKWSLFILLCKENVVRGEPDSELLLEVCVHASVLR